MRHDTITFESLDPRQLPHCYAGDDMELVCALASLSKDELYRVVQERAAMWDLLNYVNQDGSGSNFDSYDSLIYYASRIFQRQQEEEAVRKSYEGRRQEYAAKRPKLVRAMRMRGDAWECRQCKSTDSISVDHIRPLVRGGTNDLDNLQFLCRSCNSKKGDRTA